MTQRAKVCAIAMIVALVPVAAPAAIAISTKPTANMSCSRGVCKPTAKKAVLNVGDLTAMLASSDTTIKSSHQNPDIEIDAKLSWSSTSRLTLDAFHAITFDKPVTVAGSGGLTITTNDAGTGGDFLFVKQGHVEFQNLTSSLIINGNSYTLVKSIRQLLKAHGTKFALASDFNAGKTIYTASPIGGFASLTFEGLGNTISNLTINDTLDQEVGLFGMVSGTVSSPSVIRDIGVVSVNIHASSENACAGGLAGGFGEHVVVANSYVAGQVTSALNAGGLVCASVATIIGSHADVKVSGTNIVGGLIGEAASDCNGACLGETD